MNEKEAKRDLRLAIKEEGENAAMRPTPQLNPADEVTTLTAYLSQLQEYTTMSNFPRNKKLLEDTYA